MDHGSVPTPVGVMSGYLRMVIWWYGDMVVWWYGGILVW